MDTQIKYLDLVLLAGDVLFDFVLDGKRGSFGTVSEVQLAQDIANIVTNCPFAEEQFARDLAIGQSVGDKRQHTNFLRGKISEDCCIFALFALANLAEN